MKQSFTLDGLQGLLFFPFKDADSRKKMLIASLLGFGSFIIPIIPALFLIGYAGTIMRAIIIDKKEPHMPEWGNWNAYLAPGVKLFGVNFIYGLPAMIPIFLGYVMMLLPIFMSGFYSSPHGGDDFSSLMPLGMFGGFALMSMGIFLSIFLCIILPPALCHVAAKDTFSAGFQISEWWKVFRANVGGFILSTILAVGFYMGFMLVIQLIYMTLILCIFLPFLFAFMTAYLTIIIFTLYAQAYSDGVLKLDAQSSQENSIESSPAS